MADIALFTAAFIERTVMSNHALSLPRTINTLILFSLLISAHALAQDNSFAPQPQFAPLATSLQLESNNDCYRGGRSTRLMVRLVDLSALLHYATHVFLPNASASASAVPRQEMDKRRTEKGVVWRVGTEHSGVVVSASLTW